MKWFSEIFSISQFVLISNQNKYLNQILVAKLIFMASLLIKLNVPPFLKNVSVSYDLYNKTIINNIIPHKITQKINF